MLLKRIRIFISLIVLVLFILSLKFFQKSPDIFNVLFQNQIIPSILKFLSQGLTYSFFFLIIFILTIIAGRLYCSTLCPLGIVQDIIIFLKNKFKQKSRFINNKGYIRYSILFLIIISYIAGFMTFVNLLDPYSIFMRTAINIFKPVVIYSINSAVWILTKFKIYTTFHFSMHTIDLSILTVTVGTFLIIIILSIFKNRWYCNTICPVGSILGILSKYSLFNFQLNKNTCNNCKKCENSCKANCIDSRNKFIDLSRCVSCFNCVAVCPNSSISFNKNLFAKFNYQDSSRRLFLKEVAVFTLLTGCGLAKANNKSLIFGDTNIITPPGSIGLKNFTAHCSACHLCVSECPTKVLKPSFLKYGLKGIMQPELDYLKSFCDYECNKCSLVCPTGAIKPISVEEKKLTQLGKADLNRNECIVYKFDRDCGACAEHCPTKAVYMVPYKNIYGPITNTDVCIGCGSCQNVCPTSPLKAIIVEPNFIHKKIDKNAKQEDEKLKEKKNFIKKNNDFPF